MLLRYVGEDEILKEMLGDAPRQVSVCTLNDRFLLNVDVGYGTKASGNIALAYRSFRDVLKNWEEVDETEVSNL